MDRPVVNFTNILFAHLCQASFAKKSLNLKCKRNEALRKTFLQKTARKKLVKLTPVSFYLTRKRFFHDEFVAKEKWKCCRKGLRLDVEAQEADGQVDRTLAREPDP